MLEQFKSNECTPQPPPNAPNMDIRAVYTGGAGIIEGSGSSSRDQKVKSEQERKTAGSLTASGATVTS